MATPSGASYVVPSIVRWEKTERTWKRNILSRKRRHGALFVYTFTEAEYAAFRTEYISRGAEWFDMSVYSGDSFITQSVRYTQPYTKDKRNKLVIVKANIEFYDREVMSVAEVQAILGIV